MQNVFFIANIRQFLKDGILNLPSDLLISIVSLSISHTRGLFAQNLAGTAFNDFMLPITNPIDAAKHFFPSIVNRESGEINETSPLQKTGTKLKDVKKS